jgi:hypothetical protein
MRRLLPILLLLLGIITGVQAQDMTTTPLTFEAVEAGTINVINPNGLTIEYNKNNSGWTAASANPISISVATGDAVQFRGDNESYLTFDFGEKPTNFTATNPVYVYGNVMSLISSTDFATLTTLTDVTDFDGGSNLAFLFATPESDQSPFPTTNTTIRNHPTKDIVLPATTLTPSCYMYMFSGCQALTRGPELPAITLADGCYHRLFDGCTALTTAPTLPAKKLVSACYSCMFTDCSNLNYVKCLATDISADFCLEFWMDGVSSNGTFVKASTVSNYPTGNSGIPEGWMVMDATAADGDMGMTPLTMEAIEDGSFNIVNPGMRYIQYNINGGTTWTSSHSNPITIPVMAGDKVQFRGNNASYCNSEYGSDPTNFTSTSPCYVYGNVMSLINQNTWTYNKTISSDYALAYLFSDDFNANTTIRSHPYNELVLPATTLTQFCYLGMFNGCEGITTAPDLPATSLAAYCYDDMFSGCSGLTEAPKLPATTLALGCYTMMFFGCSSLETAPTLPASIVSANAYDGMFSECSSLNYVKCLATTLGSDATWGWLDGVAATGTFVKMSTMHDWELNSPNGIPAGWTIQAATEADGDDGATPLTLEVATSGTITISNPNGLGVNYEFRHGYNYQYLNYVTATTKTFEVESGDILILTGNNASYGNPDPSMAFHISSTADVYVYGNVMSLVNSWNFATLTTLTGQENFACLFGDDGTTNTTIKNHPTKDIVLGATALTESCYAMMFAGCQGLTRAPELPATTLAPICYHRMFGNCTGLTAAPTLPAPTLVSECYFAMFDGCTNLSYVKCLATDLGENNTDLWLNDVAAKGIFVQADGAAWSLNSCDGIPTGWTTTDTPLTIEAIEDGTTVTITNPLMLFIEYSIDGGATWNPGVSNPITISGIAAGGTVQLRGDNGAYSSDGTANNSTGITANKDYYLYGNIMSLVSSTDYATLTTLTEKYAFARLFRSSSHLKKHATEELVLPATTLSSNCYRYMFQNCTGLTEAPALHATTMAEACYFAMFIGCSSLTTAPELPSTKLAPGCYTGMFANSGLTTAPVLPATELAERCYYQMFYGCTALATAPALPATTVPQSGYNQMFYGCTSLTAIPDLPAMTVYDFGYNMMFRRCTGLTSYPTIPATIVGEDGMQCMFKDCSNLVIAGDLCATNLAYQSCSYMFSGCTSLTKAPALPATSLADYCYNRMFEGCTSLVTAPDLPATELAYLCYNDMFWNCTSLRNAPELPATTLSDYCYTMMFFGCSSLETAPDLPAVTLTSGCYEHMFMNCTSLNYVKCLATDLGDETSTDGWLTNVAPTGTFVKSAGVDWSEKGTTEGTWYDEELDEVIDVTFVHGIPEGWTVVEEQGNEYIFQTDGDWNVSENWNMGIVPPAGSNVVITANITVPSNYVAKAGSILIEDGKALTIADGGQLVTNHVVEGTIQKSITGYTGDKDHYYLIASPVNNFESSDENMLVAEYDLYYFDQTQQGQEWRNHKVEGQAFNLETGKGYLYANSTDVTLTIDGQLTATTEAIELTNEASMTVPGWILIGNPYPCRVTINAPYYRIDGTSLATEATAETLALNPMEGVFVHATPELASIAFTKAPETPVTGNRNMLRLQVSNSRGSHADNAIVRFDNGNSLQKFSFNEHNTKVYITKDDKDYAIINAETQSELPVNFEAIEDGIYTINVQTEGLDVEYFHLIDNMTGANVNLLTEPSYTFEAKTSDPASRFKLVFSVNETDSPSTESRTFGFINDGNIVKTQKIEVK